MRTHPDDPIVIADTRGGRNGTDPPLALPFNQVVDAVNVDWHDATLGRKRGGATVVSLTGGTTFTGGVKFLFRHLPGASESTAELWGIDAAAIPIVKRLAAGTTWANVTVDDTIEAKAYAAAGASFNGKLFLAFDSAQDRLHVYDPGLASPRIRRVGFATPGAPTLANQGAGTYAATLRYVRVRWLQITGSVVTRRSEPGAATSFTPSGSGQYMRVTQPSAPGEGETHWEIEVSTDNLTWYQRAGFERSNHQAIATTFVDDDEVVGNYTTYKSVDQVGQYTRFPSVKHLITDGNRLLGAGAWEASGANSGGKTSRVWFTPVLGSTDRGDDERLVNTTTQKNWVDLNENDGGAITGLGQIDGVVYAFKYRQIHKLRPTGNVAAPYLPDRIRADIGCVAARTISIGEDGAGRPALYFLSHRGPYRIVQVNGQHEIQYLGRDNQDIWRTMNLTADNLAHAIYYPDLHQWWVWFATEAGNLTPNTRLIMDVQQGFPDEHGQIRGGWARYTGDSTDAHSSCLFANTIGATMSLDLKPYIGWAGVTTRVFKLDTAALDDDGTDFQAYLTTRPLLTTRDLVHKVGVGESTLLAKAAASTSVTVTISRDFGRETRAHTVSLAPAGSETRVVKKVEGSEMGEADAVQMTIGDSAASEATWTLDALITPVVRQERR